MATSKKKAKKSAAKAPAKKAVKAAAKKKAPAAVAKTKKAAKAAAKPAKGAKAKAGAGAKKSGKGAPVKKSAVKAAKPAAKKAAKATAKAAPKATAKSAPKGAGKSQAKVLDFAAARAKSKIDWNSFFTPLDDRVVVMIEGAADRTPGGLYIPETVADKPNQGRVVAVGRGHRDKKGRLRPLDVQLGDRVMYAKYAGTNLDLEGQDVILLREDEILAVLSK